MESLESQTQLSLLETYKNQFIPVQEIYKKIKSNSDGLHEKDQYENTILHYAVKDSKAVLVELLIKCGASPNALNIYNENVLLFGLNNGNVSFEVLKLLLNNNLSVNDTDKWGRSACFFASRNLEFLKLLCKHGAIINIGNENSFTPLMRSAITEPVETIRYMVEQLKASPDPTDDKGKSALTYAIDASNDYVAYYLMNEACTCPYNEIQKSSIKRFMKKKLSSYEIF